MWVAVVMYATATDVLCTDELCVCAIHFIKLIWFVSFVARRTVYIHYKLLLFIFFPHSKHSKLNGAYVSFTKRYGSQRIDF